MLGPRAAGSVELSFNLGSAYLAAGQAADAATQLERVVNNGAQGGLSSIEYVRSLYLLGAISEKQGNRDKARDYYRRFAAFWKDADIDHDRVAAAQRSGI